MTIKSDIVLQLAHGCWTIGFILHFIASLRVAFNKDYRYFEDHNNYIIIPKYNRINGKLMLMTAKRKYIPPTIPENDTNFVSIVNRMCGELTFNFGIVFKIFSIGFTILYLIFR